MVVSFGFRCPLNLGIEPFQKCPEADKQCGCQERVIACVSRALRDLFPARRTAGAIRAEPCRSARKPAKCVKEYRRGDLRRGVRGKYYREYIKGRRSSASTSPAPARSAPARRPWRC